MKPPALPSPFGPTEPRFYRDRMGVVHDRTGLYKPEGYDAVVEVLNKLAGEIAELRMLDSEWWTLASGEGVGTPDDETRSRVNQKVNLLLNRFYERGKRAGREEAAQASTARPRGRR